MSDFTLTYKIGPKEVVHNIAVNTQIGLAISLSDGAVCCAKCGEALYSEAFFVRFGTTLIPDMLGNLVFCRVCLAEMYGVGPNDLVSFLDANSASVCQDPEKEADV